MTVTALGAALTRRATQTTLHIAGIDLGNRTSILVDGASATQIPSIISRSGDLARLQAVRAGGGGAGALDPGEYVVQHAGITYYVGALALAQDPTGATSGSADASRYYNGHTLVLLMALVGAAYGGDVRLRLVTGVPPALVTDQPDIKTKIAEAFIGTHYFTFTSSAGTREIAMTVENIVTLMESVAAGAAFGVPGKPCGVLDIGWHTTDLARLDRNGKVVAAHSLASAGMERVGAVLSAQFKRQYGRALAADEIAATFDNYVRGEPTTIYHRGERVVTTEDVRNAIAAVAPVVNGFLATHWGSADGTVAADVACVLAIGGGALFFDQLTIDTDVKRFAAPQEMNARAYAAFAQRVDQAGKWPQRGI